MKSFKTVTETVSAELTEKRSRFIATLAHVEDEQAALSFLNEMRSKYWDAKHNVYAYSINESGVKRFSDDSEPHGTAGKPVLDVITGNGLDNVIIVVTRYFGGVLLGTGGLVRAYSGAASLAVQNAAICEMTPCVKVSVVSDYSRYDNLCRLIDKFPHGNISTDYADMITVNFYLDLSFKDDFSAELKNTFFDELTAKFEEEISFPLNK